MSDTPFPAGTGADPGTAAGPDTSAGPDTVAAARALRAGGAVILPNPSPLTYVVTATTPRAVNDAKGRRAGQEVALWVHEDATWWSLATALDLEPAALRAAFTLLREQLVTLLVPVRAGAPAPPWTDPALRDGHLLLFGAQWTPVSTLLRSFPRLYVSSANRTGMPPADTAARATAMFGPGVPVVDADHLRCPGTPHAATTMLRMGTGGDLSHVRRGAQDRAHGADPDAYPAYLRATEPHRWRPFGQGSPAST
ncbi:hypothetical protein OG389_32820 [Streptomyces sp. NBC_00435]|uniref:hypothetical protein n=1 Tax=Streptomyces sp. NBC_00435 TaxID=2903649 RepID=UPI002E2425FE